MNLIGSRFSRLVVVGLVRPGKHARWRCRCDCGNEREIIESNLRRGHTRSCGCLSVEVRVSANTTHGHTSGGKYSSEWYAYTSMRSRCLRPQNRLFHAYGGRGVQICDRWLSSFSNFIEDMGRKPSVTHSLDRIDVDGNYEPSNCRWATPVEQARNKTTTRWVTYRGERISFAEACERSGLPRGTVQARLQSGWSEERAFSEAIHRNSRSAA